jgi:hypothetical protein
MKFDMSEAWRQATAMISANREVLLVVAGLFFFLPSVAMGFAIGDVQKTAFADPENAGQAMLAIYTDWWWLFLLIMLASVIGYLALLTLLRGQQRPTVGEALKSGLAGLPSALATYLIFALAAGFVLVALSVLAGVSGSPAIGIVAVLLWLIVMVYAMVKVSLAGPVIALDKLRNPFGVLGRSWRLTKGNSFRLFAFYLLLGIAYIVLSIVAGIIVGVLTLAVGQSAALIVNALLTGLLSAAATTIFVAVLAAVHRQLSGGSPERLAETFE